MGQLLDHVADEIFDAEEHKRYWIILIGIESAYNSKAKSRAGAVGLGQLLPKYLDDFGSSCGLTGLTEEDLADNYTNLYLSACYFRHLIQQTSSIPLALVAYNAGPNSETLRRAIAGLSINTESANHASKAWIKSSQLD